MLLSTDASGNSKWVSLSSYQHLHRSTYGYFLSLIDLSAELCLGRNELALKNLQDMFNFDAVKLIIKNETLPFEMRAIFMRILLNLHMD